MLDNVRGERAAKIHRQMHSPIMHDHSAIVHLEQKTVPVKPRDERIIGKEQVANSKQTMSLAALDERLSARKEGNKAARLTAKEIKEREIEKAMKVASKKVHKTKKSDEVIFGFRRIILATACAAAAVFAIVYFVNLNSTDISLKVTAMQSGIEAVYPSYVPRDYSLSDITSEDGKIVMNFKNLSEGDSYTLSEEASSWDSTALLNNFVKKEFGENYTVLREQGLTIYTTGSDAVWVNGGMIFRIKVNSGNLTKKQIQAIATSL